MSQFTHCSHGKSYQEDCLECDKVWFHQVTLPDLISSAKRAAHFASNNPGIVERSVGPGLAALNSAIAVLAQEVQTLKGGR